MDTRVAVISIIVENPEAIETLNHLLHEAGQYIIGRMGLPYEKKHVNIISVIETLRPTGSARFPGSLERSEGSVRK